MAGGAEIGEVITSKEASPIDDEARLAEICAERGVNYGQKTVLTFGSTRLLCCTLWTDFLLDGDAPRAMRRAAGAMNDYQLIRMIGREYGRIVPSDTALVHAGHVEWLSRELARPWSGRSVVITHHAPHRSMLPDTRSDLAPAYASDLTPLIEAYRPALWLCGHTHVPVEIRVGETTIRNVSLGYPSQVVRGREEGVLWAGLLEL